MSNVELEQSPTPADPGFLQFHPDIYKHITSDLLKQDISFVMLICFYKFATSFELHATNGEVITLQYQHVGIAFHVPTLQGFVHGGRHTCWLRALVP
jgi:hypothetical protein